MSLTPAEAHTALKDIEKTENRAAASQHGRIAAPYLILWGVIYVIGYAAMGFAVELSWRQSSWIWAPLVAAGVLGSFLLGRRKSETPAPGFAWRYGLSFIVLFVFIAAMFSILRPRESNQIGAFYPIAIGLYYCFIGIWSKGGWRMLPLGLALIALTVAGYFFLPDHFMFWMAAVGGGGLILGGLWLRST